MLGGMPLHFHVLLLLRRGAARALQGKTPLEAGRCMR